MDISLVIPLFNEEESLPELAAWIERVTAEHKLSYEIIFVDDGSTDDSWNVIMRLRASNPTIKGIKFQRNYGKSAALNEGFRAAQGEVVITMDADLQDSPDEIPELRRMIIEDKYDLVSGWKKKRYDNKLTKNLPSKLFNAAARQMSKIKLHDFNCGLKSYRNKVVKSIEVYGEMHRYVPVLAKWAGFRRIGEKVVEHRARKYGVTKFGWTRFINGFLDLMTIFFMGKFGKRPMHFFGLWGSVFFLIGIAFSIYLAVSKIIDFSYPITNRPGFYMALTSIIIGMQL
ncbi:MAG: glycosyltransferase family 2 protein, partial [Chitinophagaceae bacterium]|nr:glycosyltransferase family 2 protein [Chitinophagaceae bacterium]